MSLHPAGHILGSSQVRIEHEGRVWVISGDYKRQPDPTCAPFEPVECDVFISEATFALPVYRWPDTTRVVEEVHRWWRSNRERGIASVLFCYALGKSQRVLSELRAFTDEPVYVHGAVDSLTGVYRRAGVGMLPTLPVGTDRKIGFPRRLDPCATQRRRDSLDAAVRRPRDRLLLRMDAGSWRPPPARL